MRVGTKVTSGKEVGIVVGREWIDDVMYVGIRWKMRSFLTGGSLFHTAWYTIDDLKKYGIEPVERGEVA